jgi:hypothetical protein
MTYKRVDDNQKAITQLFRKLGWSVLILSEVGKGCPDLLVGHDLRNYLIEVKDGSKPRSAQKLTTLEQKFFDEWKGDVRVINSVDGAIQFANERNK